MTGRDRRALLILAFWGLALGLYFGGRALYDFRKDWLQSKLRLQYLQTRQGVLKEELGRMAKSRADYALAFPKEWQSQSMDQLRLKGQGGLLEGAQRAGLKGVRLREESMGQGTAGRQLGWALDGEGTLPQWVEAFDAIEKSQPFMSIHGYRLELTGDPWHPEVQGEAGPSVKGSAKCAWVIGP